MEKANEETVTRRFSTGDLVTVAMLPMNYAGSTSADCTLLQKTRALCSGWNSSEVES